MGLQLRPSAYGILQIIMRLVMFLTALLGPCLLAGGQSAPARQQPKAQSSVSGPASPQAPSDEALMKRTAQATIEWDRATTQGTKVNVQLIKKDQAEGKPMLHYHIKVSGASREKLYTLMAWPITTAQPFTMMEGLAIATDGTVGCPPDSLKSCGQHMKGAELKLTYTPGIGEIYRHALISEDHSSRIFFSIVPAPMIEHDKSCSLEIVRLSPRFELAVVRGKGFTPGEQLIFHTESYQERHDLQTRVNPQGEFWATLSPFVKGRTMGTTQVAVKGASCSPALSFGWGSE
jgi:hypothetical protein